jgi:hypothetical protein
MLARLLASKLSREVGELPGRLELAVLRRVHEPGLAGRPAQRLAKAAGPQSSQGRAARPRQRAFHRRFREGDAGPAERRGVGRSDCCRARLSLWSRSADVAPTTWSRYGFMNFEISEAMSGAALFATPRVRSAAASKFHGEPLRLAAPVCGLCQQRVGPGDEGCRVLGADVGDCRW